MWSVGVITYVRSVLRMIQISGICSVVATEILLELLQESSRHVVSRNTDILSRSLFSSPLDCVRAMSGR